MSHRWGCEAHWFYNVSRWQKVFLGQSASCDDVITVWPLQKLSRGLVSSCRLDLHDEAGSPDCDIMPPQLLDKMQLQLSCQKWTTLIKMIEETCIYTITMDTMWIQLYMLLLLFVGFICGLKPHCHQPYLCITSYCSLTGAVHVLLYSISSHCGNNMAAT